MQEQLRTFLPRIQASVHLLKGHNMFLHLLDLLLDSPYLDLLRPQILHYSS
jgi:hypothetical protein